jgi:hypothetical protein
MEHAMRKPIILVCTILMLAFRGTVPLDSCSDLSGYELVAHLVSAEDFAAALPAHREMLVNLAQRDPASFTTGACCWTPGMPSAVMMAINQMLEGPGSDYELATRWAFVATPGGTGTQGSPTTLTYSFVPDGTWVPGGTGEPGSVSDLFATFNGIIPGGPTGWQAYFHQAFQQWGAVTGITYVHEANDDGAALFSASGVLGVRGDVRICGHSIDGQTGPNTLAYNNYPNSGGDMVIDTDNTSFFGNSGSTYRRLRNTVMHEHGHGMGLKHSCPQNSTKLMEPTINLGFDGPQEDDILGGQRHYGDPFESNDSPSTATDRGTLNNGGHFITGASIDDNSDSDYYKFTVTSNKEVNLTLTPVGSTYSAGPQTSSCGPGTTIVANAIHDLGFQILDINGISQLANVNNTVAGQPEFAANVHLASGPGTYFIRVLGSTANDVQRYTILMIVLDSVQPVLGMDPVCGQGTVGILAPGGIEEPFEINFQTGGVARRVDVPMGTSFTMRMNPPSMAVGASPFVIFGRFGVPGPGESLPLPLNIGTMCFGLPMLSPGDPTLFILTDNLTFGPALIPSWPAPWIAVIPGIPFISQFALQGLIVENAVDIRTTNAILLNIN